MRRLILIFLSIFYLAPLVNAQNYLPLTGGTLTGGLLGTTGTFNANVTAPNVPYGTNDGAHTYLGATSANTIWRAGFYTAYNTPDAFNTGDFGFVSIPLWGGQNSSARYNLQIGANIAGNPVFRNTDINGIGSWYTIYTSRNFNPDNYLLQSGGNITGNLAIGTTNAHGYKLAVAGNMIAESVKVKIYDQWPDYVFEDDYKSLLPDGSLETLETLEGYIKLNKHLPGMPTAKEVQEDGINLGEMNALLLKKVEELTLYIIELNRQNKIQQRLINEQDSVKKSTAKRSKLYDLEARIAILELEGKSRLIN